MKQALRVITLGLMVFGSTPSQADITWDWSFGGESGEFRTTGNPADLFSGSATFDYVFDSFAVTTSAGGSAQSADPATLPYTGTASSPCCPNAAGTLDWNGTSVTDLTSSGGVLAGGWDFNAADTAPSRPYIYSLTQSTGELREWTGSSSGFVSIASGAVSITPRASSPNIFSIIVIPDTQFYTELYPNVLDGQIDWIVANQAAENIVYVAHLGDLKDDQLCDNRIVNGRPEWEIISDALQRLENASIPYGVLPGNHDFDQLAGGCPNWDTQRPLTSYNTYFGPARYASQPYYGDMLAGTPGNRVADSNEDNFTLFGFAGIEFIAINLAFRPDGNTAGNDAEITWADNLLKAYPDRLGIITTHYFLDWNGEVGSSGPFNQFGPYGQEVYDGLSDNPNLFMMLSGHWFGEAWRVNSRGGTGMLPVHALLQDYQSTDYPTNPLSVDYANLDGSPSNLADGGFMRIMRFNTDTGMVDIETFTPAIAALGRSSDLVSDYFPANGTGMDKDTASNISIPFYGYGYGYIPPTEMLGLRFIGGSTIPLAFSAVKNLATLEDRTIIHFDISAFPGSFSVATLNIGVDNIDAGPGTLDVYSFAGDGTVSTDEWASGSLVQTVLGIGPNPETLVVDITSVLATAISNGDSHLSFRLSTTDVAPNFNRYWLDATVTGTTTPISTEGPTYLSIAP